MSKSIRIRDNSSGRILEATIEIVNGDGTFTALSVAEASEIIANSGEGLMQAGNVPDASESGQGLIELATSAEVITGTDTERAVTPAGLAARTATTSRTGLAEIATDAEAKAAADATRTLTPDNLAQGGPAVSGTLEAMFAQHYQITPVLGTATAVHAAITLAEGTTTEVTTAITNPDFPRLVTVKGNQAGVAGNVVIDGTDIAGNVIQDTIALSDDSEVAGVKAFKTVTKITVPQRVAEGDTVSVGVDDVFGMPHVIPYTALLLVALFNSADDAGSSLAVNASLPLNLYTPAGTPNGSKKFDFYYLV